MRARAVFRGTDQSRERVRVLRAADETAVGASLLFHSSTDPAQGNVPSRFHAPLASVAISLCLEGTVDVARAVCHDDVPVPLNRLHFSRHKDHTPRDYLVLIKPILSDCLSCVKRPSCADTYGNNCLSSGGCVWVPTLVLHTAGLLCS